MDCCFDRTGFPYLELQDPALAVSLLPLTKLQFEYYLADLTPQGDNWYEELLNRIYFETHSFPLTVTLPFPPPSWGRARVGGTWELEPTAAVLPPFTLTLTLPRQGGGKRWL